VTTAYATDARFALHTLDTHPEHAGRLLAIERALAASGLLSQVTQIEPRAASPDDLLAVHDADYLTRLAATQGQPLKMLDADTYVTPRSYEVAQIAAGAALAVVDAVLGGSATNGLAAVRPPGHHATPGRAMGFCLLNNVAIAARYAQRHHGIGRVAIVDYDVHHGNGTQAIFYADPLVLYISTHQYPLYPGTGAAAETGSGRGEGFTVNLPLPPGVGDAGYWLALDGVIAPVLRRYAPDLLLLSAGFDAHWADPLAQMNLSLAGYDALTRALVELAEELCAGRLVAVLEGGYHLTALAAGWCNTVRALAAVPGYDDPLGPAPTGPLSIEPLLASLRAIHNIS